LTRRQPDKAHEPQKRAQGGITRHAASQFGEERGWAECKLDEKRKEEKVKVKNKSSFHFSFSFSFSFCYCCAIEVQLESVFIGFYCTCVIEELS